ncbi:MAG: hypothetical protein IJ347_02235, partial [Faecalibacterium sp.]|nr:hypothetical protein [Faecalibacterium sp.]
EGLHALSPACYNNKDCAVYVFTVSSPANKADFTLLFYNKANQTEEARMDTPSLQERMDDRWKTKTSGNTIIPACTVKAAPAAAM